MPAHQAGGFRLKLLLEQDFCSSTYLSNFLSFYHRVSLNHYLSIYDVKVKNVYLVVLLGAKTGLMRKFDKL